MPREAIEETVATRQRQIPGFFWDEERSRYFKIAHPASGGQYSASAITKRRKTEEATRIAASVHNLAQLQRHDKGFLKRKCSAVQSIVLNRSLGIANPDAQAISRAKQLHSDPEKGRLLDIARQRAKIAYDDKSDTMYIASSRFISAHTMRHNQHQPIQPWNQQLQPMVPIAPLRSAASSLTYHSRLELLIGTSVGDGDRPAEIFVKTGFGGRIATVDGTLWCSATHVDHSQFVVAGSVVLLYDCLIGDSSRRPIKCRKGLEVMTMDYLDTHVVALGCRSGDLHLYDVRTHDALAKPRFRHKTTQSVGIAKVKALNPFQILISGLRSSLALYDTRFLKEERAIMTYLGHQNAYDLNTNSLDTSGQIMAVAQSSKDVGIWHLNGTHLDTKTTAGPVDDLIFHKTPNGHEKLWTISQGLLEEWTF